MFIYCNDNVIKIENRGNAINIEIQFNLSEYGKEWREIGDALYNFTDIHVNSVQFNFILTAFSQTAVSKKSIKIKNKN